MEKSIFAIGTGDGRLSNGDKTISLNDIGGGPDRGSLELEPTADGYNGDFYPGRDLEVKLNGVICCLTLHKNQQIRHLTMTNFYLRQI